MTRQAPLIVIRPGLLGTATSGQLAAVALALVSVPVTVWLLLSAVTA
jgi:hypothetical protein